MFSEGFTAREVFRGPGDPGLPAAEDALSTMTRDRSSSQSATEEKPRVLVLRSPHLDMDAIREGLGDAFELVVAEPGDALNTLTTTECRAIFAGAGDFLPLERQLVSHQAAMLLDAIGEGVGLTDRRGTVLWANGRFRSFEGELRQRLRSIIDEAVAEFEQLLEQRRVEAERRRESGQKPDPGGLFPPKRFTIALQETQRFFDCVITPVFPPTAASGAPPAVLAQLAVVVRDVTNREQTQRKINALDRAGRELIQLEPDVVRNMHAADRLADLQHRVERIARELLSFDHFSVRLRDDKDNQLRVVMSAGMPSEAIELPLYANEQDNGISGYVAATGFSYNCPDASADPLYVFGMEQAGSSLTVPLRLFDSVIGILNVESDEVAAFSDQDRQFAEIFASYLAMSLHILNLLVVERSQTRETTTGTIQGELSAPLNDLTVDVEALMEAASASPALKAQIERVMRDVGAIKGRIKRIAAGPQTLLGIEEALAASESDPILMNRRVLVVDNDGSMLETVQDILRSRGALVVTASEGQVAIRLLDQWALTHDQTEAFDLIVSDISLDDATGYDVFASAKKANPDVPVVLMTGFGYDPHHSIVRASQEGLQSVLFKPFQAQSLIDDCRKAIDPEAAAAAAAEKGEQRGE